MSTLPKIVPVSDLRDEAAALLADLRQSHSPVVITQRGRASAVLINVEDYEAAEEERKLLRKILIGERELASGRGRTLEEVLSAARKIVAP